MAKELKLVRIIIDRNKTWEVERVEPEEKTSYWWTKVELRQIRNDYKEEVMMDGVRSLVRTRIQQEFPDHDPNDEDDNDFMEDKIDDIMTRPPSKIAEYLESTPSTPKRKSKTDKKKKKKAGNNSPSPNTKQRKKLLLKKDTLDLELDDKDNDSPSSKKTKMKKRQPPSPSKKKRRPRSSTVEDDDDGADADNDSDSDSDSDSDDTSSSSSSDSSSSSSGSSSSSSSSSDSDSSTERSSPSSSPSPSPTIKKKTKKLLAKTLPKKLAPSDDIDVRRNHNGDGNDENVISDDDIYDLFDVESNDEDEDSDTHYNSNGHDHGKKARNRNGEGPKSRSKTKPLSPTKDATPNDDDDDDNDDHPADAAAPRRLDDDAIVVQNGEIPPPAPPIRRVSSVAKSPPRRSKAMPLRSKSLPLGSKKSPTIPDKKRSSSPPPSVGLSPPSQRSPTVRNSLSSQPRSNRGRNGDSAGGASNGEWTDTATSQSPVIQKNKEGPTDTSASVDGKMTNDNALSGKAHHEEGNDQNGNTAHSHKVGKIAKAFDRKSSPKSSPAKNDGQADCPICLGLVEASDERKIVLLRKMLCTKCYDAYYSVFETAVLTSPSAKPYVSREKEKKKKGKKKKKESMKRSLSRNDLSPVPSSSKQSVSKKVTASPGEKSSPKKPIRPKAPPLSSPKPSVEQEVNNVPSVDPVKPFAKVKAASKETSYVEGLFNKSLNEMDAFLEEMEDVSAMLAADDKKEDEPDFKPIKLDDFIKSVKSPKMSSADSISVRRGHVKKSKSMKDRARSTKRPAVGDEKTEDQQHSPILSPSAESSSSTKRRSKSSTRKPSDSPDSSSKSAPRRRKSSRGLGSSSRSLGSSSRSLGDNSVGSIDVSSPISTKERRGKRPTRGGLQSSPSNGSLAGGSISSLDASSMPSKGRKKPSSRGVRVTDSSNSLGAGSVGSMDSPPNGKSSLRKKKTSSPLSSPNALDASLSSIGSTDSPPKGSSSRRKKVSTKISSRASKARVAANGIGRSGKSKVIADAEAAQTAKTDDMLESTYQTTRRERVKRRVSRSSKDGTSAENAARARSRSTGRRNKEEVKERLAKRRERKRAEQSRAEAGVNVNGGSVASGGGAMNDSGSDLASTSSAYDEEYDANSVEDSPLKKPGFLADFLRGKNKTRDGEEDENTIQSAPL
eukprot:CAMPEP_0113505868 /NCGR_PEP_ID=MMETSP0014_2-20120614/35572_1 /TAXON_ID=2857 /ORGANISM="Nitzschia sp." /LENGTH=1170 /DNA_ID=CAMNT_0000401261 /DNA_START=433 /DNA_END=3945 /DNA_ORIENTATION=+ /assembly_acc=CAM_ASM_000159